MSLPNGPLVAWYGDDFTGAAAVAEVLEFAGLPSMVFLSAPDPAVLARFGVGLRGIGIAGDARARSPEWMDRELPEVFRWLAETGAPVRHYKVCSTLDSSPQTGSIGRAMELGLAALGDRAGALPVLIGAPGMGRWVAFGQLFARAGDGIHRLDRHPVMARHPVTPMDEADIARHLARQTELPTANLMLSNLVSESAVRASWRSAEAGARALVLDSVDEAQMALLGRILWDDAPRIPFVVGSQGVEMALVAHWREAGLLPPPLAPRGLGRAERFAVVSGSVSPTTAEQIAAAEAAGFVTIPLDTPAIAAGNGDLSNAVEQALTALASGRSPIVHSALGPTDPRVATVSTPDAGDRIGAALAHVLGALIDRGGVTRAIIAGGDTSGRVAQALGVAALRPLAHVAPGASVMRAFSSAPVRDGLELVLKGGQMGPPDLFARVRDGHAPEADKTRDHRATTSRPTSTGVTLCRP
ncbi:four-carbon acid sugar kinase family protein [Paracoccus sp. S-4012]|uniref:four-carbon acid sugar kinase family protein n=1 Tax=Paracoccus sp. S-4012 TaxID=2665648 RepID=UPI0012AF8E57|nr:four-carbon acid sugar kinase family protein [Paracoccus sp. S-4012]MRX52080.1 four-carbon acid sugar kinase family protein [Paracoccus sp. S-4012]